MRCNWWRGRAAKSTKLLVVPTPLRLKDLYSPSETLSFDGLELPSSPCSILKEANDTVHFDKTCAWKGIELRGYTDCLGVTMILPDRKSNRRIAYPVFDGPAVCRFGGSERQGKTFYRQRRARRSSLLTIRLTFCCCVRGLRTNTKKFFKSHRRVRI